MTACRSLDSSAARTVPGVRNSRWATSLTSRPAAARSRTRRWRLDEPGRRVDGVLGTVAALRERLRPRHGPRTGHRRRGQRPAPSAAAARPRRRRRRASAPARSGHARTPGSRGSPDSSSTASRSSAVPASAAELAEQPQGTVRATWRLPSGAAARPPPRRAGRPPRAARCRRAPAPSGRARTPRRGWRCRAARRRRVMLLERLRGTALLEAQPRRRLGEQPTALAHPRQRAGGVQAAPPRRRGRPGRPGRRR